MIKSHSTSKDARSTVASLQILLVGPEESVHTQLWRSSFQDAGHRVVLASLPKDYALRRPRGLLQAWRRVYRLSRRCDLLIVQSMGSHGLFALLLSRKAKCVVVPWGSEVFGAQASRARRWVVRRLLRRSDLIATTTRDMVGLLRGFSRSTKMHYITASWGVNDEFLGLAKDDDWALRSSLKEELAISGEDVLAVSTRGMKPVYRPGIIREGFDLARRERPELKLVIIDTALPEGGEISNDESTRVAIAPALSKAKLAALYQLADISISIPRADQRSTSVLESIASGAVVILADLPAYREIAADGAVVNMLSTTDAAGLARALTAAPRRGEFQSGNQSWARANERQLDCMTRIVSACAGVVLSTSRPKCYGIVNRLTGD